MWAGETRGCGAPSVQSRGYKSSVLGEDIPVQLWEVHPCSCK